MKNDSIDVVAGVSSTENSPSRERLAPVIPSRMPSSTNKSSIVHGDEIHGPNLMGHELETESIRSSTIPGGYVNQSRSAPPKLLTIQERLKLIGGGIATRQEGNELLTVRKNSIRIKLPKVTIKDKPSTTATSVSDNLCPKQFKSGLSLSPHDGGMDACETQAGMARKVSLADVAPPAVPLDVNLETKAKLILAAARLRLQASKAAKDGVPPLGVLNRGALINKISTDVMPAAVKNEAPSSTQSTAVSETPAALPSGDCVDESTVSSYITAQNMKKEERKKSLENISRKVPKANNKLKLSSNQLLDLSEMEADSGGNDSESSGSSSASTCSSTSSSTSSSSSSSTSGSSSSSSSSSDSDSSSDDESTQAPLKPVPARLKIRSRKKNDVKKKCRFSRKASDILHSFVAPPAPPKIDAPTEAEIRKILREDSATFGDSNCHFVRRSSRQPSKSILNSASVRDLLDKLQCNDSDMVVLKLKKYLNDPDIPSVIMNATFGALEENTNCQALYIQNFNNAMHDDQMMHLLRILQSPKCRIWCLNIGETYNVSNKAWKKFAKGLRYTKITHMYASEHTITPELKEKFRDVIRDNRIKHTMHNDPNNLHVIIRCTHCWWNPINSSKLQPFIKNSAYEHVLFDRVTLGLKGTTDGTINIDTI